MIYFLRSNESGKVSIRYYRTRDHFEEAAVRHVGLEVLRIERGGRERLYRLEERFRRNLDLLGTAFRYTGELAQYLEEPAELTEREVCHRFALTSKELKVAMRRAGAARITAANVADIYAAHRKSGMVV